MPFKPRSLPAGATVGGDLAGTLPSPTISTISGDLKHTGTKVGFYGATAAARTGGYTQTYAVATRSHAAGALSTSVSVALLTDVPALINTTNSALNEVKQLLNQLIDDLQAYGLLQ